jgi:hypothetical protein
MIVSTGVDHALDVIRAAHAYRGIVQRHSAAGDQADFMAEWHAVLDGMPANRRSAAIAAVVKRMRRT